MAKMHNLLLSLNGGEVSPRFEPRKDQKKYESCVEVLENWIPMTLGGIKRRVGFRMVNEAKLSGLDNNRVRLVSFKFSNEQVYILEFGHLYIRFYRAGARIEDPPGTPYEITTTYLNADLNNLFFFQSADVLYICHQSYFTRKLVRTSLDTFLLQTVQFNPPALVEHTPNGTELTGVGGGGGLPPEEPTDPGE